MGGHLNKVSVKQTEKKKHLPSKKKEEDSTTRLYHAYSKKKKKKCGCFFCNGEYDTTETDTQIHNTDTQKWNKSTIKYTNTLFLMFSVFDLELIFICN